MKKSILKLKTVLSIFIIMATSIISNNLCAQNTSVSAKQQGFYRMKLGDFEVIALFDGAVPQNLNELLKGTKSGEISKVMGEHGKTAMMDCSVNAYLIKTKDKLILIDAGTADAYGPLLGHLTENMQRAGFQPEQINAVLLTHLHTDHIGGLMTGDKITFPNAQVYVSKAEADYFLDPNNKEKAPEAMKRYFDGAVQKLGPIEKAGKLIRFQFGKELFPGIMPLASFGHTAGHTFYAVRSKGHKILFWGDIVLSDLVQFEHPSVTSLYDFDEKIGVSVRERALADAEKSGYYVAVSHIDFPGIGHIIKNVNGYQFIPLK